MSEKEHPRVHFGEDADSFGKDNEIVIKGPSEGKITAHLGFLQVGHRYEITLNLPLSLLQTSTISGIQESQHNTVPNVNCKFTDLTSDNKDLNMKIELFAHKEKLLKEELHLDGCNAFTTLAIIARVLGKGKGTPLLKNGIKCIGVELEDESEASDWQGFE
ncbi:hypothetical protein L9F63_009772 [Diploptera punctata]|uniref:Adipose-secreted signaling protein n=1 Tax=Diploptera punctata TaxID=6984 RepID=A0AAD8AJ12_DIPPU|nr:hypothetical protein L9F63_009772 [Diploptera punctata]